MPSPSDRVSDASIAPYRRQVDRETALLGVRFSDALAAGDGARAEAIALQARSGGLSVAAVYGRVITPALYVIGDLWECGEIGVADEQLTTVICQRVLAALHATLREVPPRKRGHVMLAAPAGERHTIGLRMAADVLEGAGYDVTYLGGDVPSQELRDAVRRYQPGVLGLSVTTQDGVTALAQAIEAALAARPDLTIALGGPAAPADLVGRRLAFVPDVEAAPAIVGQLLEAAGDACRPPRIGASALTVAVARAATSGAERLASATEQIAELARDQARRAEHYRALAFEDELCGLPNRRAFDDRFRQLAEQHRAADDPPLMVMLLDLDGLKAINDQLGHDAGDVALRMIAGALRTHLREHDLPARLGGDEFGALLPGLEPATAVLVAERVCAAIRDGFAGNPPPVTACCGIARFDGERRSTLVRADQSLYEAKRSGRDRVLLAS